jgi:hypothetical protein
MAKKKITTLKDLLDKKYLKRTVTSWRTTTPTMPKHEKANISLETMILGLADMCRADAKERIVDAYKHGLNPVRVLDNDVFRMASFHIPLSVIKHRTRALSGINSELVDYARNYHLLN